MHRAAQLSAILSGKGDISRNYDHMPSFKKHCLSNHCRFLRVYMGEIRI